MAEAKNTILIGIAGGTGSGKTTLADKVVDSFGRDEVSILRHDNYYKRHDEMNYEDRSKLNYDHPDAFFHRLCRVFVHIFLSVLVEIYPTFVIDFVLGRIDFSRLCTDYGDI